MNTSGRCSPFSPDGLVHRQTRTHEIDPAGAEPKVPNADPHVLKPSRRRTKSYVGTPERRFQRAGTVAPNVDSDATGSPAGGARRDVPICATARMASTVVMARRSVHRQAYNDGFGSAVAVTLFVD